MLICDCDVTNSGDCGSLLANFLIDVGVEARALCCLGEDTASEVSARYVGRCCAASVVLQMRWLRVQSCE